MPNNTPWGIGKECEWSKCAEGVYFVSTPSHGGYLITQERRNAMPEPYKSIPTFAGGNWYEEDCDWALVALSFPEAFPKMASDIPLADIAQKTFEMYHAKKVTA